MTGGLAPRPLPARLLREWRAVPGPGAAWLESLAPLQYVAYALRDTDGFPLGELNVPPPHRPTDVELRVCPYADARRGSSMNVTALRRVQDRWPAVLASAASMRAAWSADRRVPEPLDAAHLWAFSASIVALPIFLVRTGSADDGTVPAEVSALFKVMQGVFMTAWQAWGASDAVPIEADALTAAILDAKLLHNVPNGRVCPAPAGRIRELLDVVLRAPSDLPRVDADGLFVYGAAYAALTLEKCLMRDPSAPGAATLEQHRDALAGWTRPPDTPEARITQLQRAACAACGVPGPADEFRQDWVRIVRPEGSAGA